jgi:hypothetical protein
VPVDGTWTPCLDPSSYDVRSTFTQDCSAFSSVPAGAVAGWQVVLPQADTQNPENVFDTVTLEFATAGPMTITPGPSAYATTVTPTDDVLLNGAADGSQSVAGPFPAFFTLVATCYTPPPPPPPPPTTTTTTVAPVPPPSSPPGNPGPGPTPSAPNAPPTKGQVLFKAASVKLPFTGSLFGLKPAVATTTTTAPVAAAPRTPARPRRRQPRVRARPRRSTGASSRR